MKDKTKELLKKIGRWILAGIASIPSSVAGSALYDWLKSLKR